MQKEIITAYKSLSLKGNQHTFITLKSQYSFLKILCALLNQEDSKTLMICIDILKLCFDFGNIFSKDNEENIIILEMQNYGLNNLIEKL